MSLPGRITRSRSRAATTPESDSLLREPIGSNMSLTEQSEIAHKLSELLEVIKKSVSTSEQTSETLTETHQLGLRNRTDLLKLHTQQQAQLATIAAQNNSQVGPALQPTPFYGNPTDDLLAFLNHFERYSDFCGWDKTKRLRALPLYLQGNAGSWYGSIDAKTFKTYEDIVEALKRQFSNPASMWLWRQQLSARKQGEAEPLANYVSDIRRLCKRLGLNDIEAMHQFIQGLRTELRGHVVLGQPKTLAEAETLANLKEAVLINAPINPTQQNLENQLQSVIKNLETLTATQQNQAQNIAAYRMYPRTSSQPDTSYESHWHRPTPPGPRHDTEQISKLIEQEVRRQTRFMTPTNRASNSGVPSSRNRRTTDGLPICNKCDKIGHIARNCRAENMRNHEFSQRTQYDQQRVRDAQFRPQNVQDQATRAPQNNSHIFPEAPAFVPRQGHISNNPFRSGSGN